MQEGGHLAYLHRPGEEVALRLGGAGLAQLIQLLQVLLFAVSQRSCIFPMYDGASSRQGGTRLDRSGRGEDGPHRAELAVGEWLSR